MSNRVIRAAVDGERSSLEALQWRAALANSGDRENLLAHPDAIALPIEQIAADCVFVAECDSIVVGFAAVVPCADGGAELDALFVEPNLWRHGIGRRLVERIVDVARGRAATFQHVIGNPHAEDVLPFLRLLNCRNARDSIWRWSRHAPIAL
jgi:GNAT superfamily N-acetyltransferase